MKYILKIISFMTMLTSINIVSDCVLPAYNNMVTDLYEIQTQSSYTLVLKCQNQNPIAMYSPANFQESLSDTVHRVYMPNTHLSDQVKKISGVVDFDGSGVQLLLPGKLQHKMVGDGLVVFKVAIAK